MSPNRIKVPQRGNAPVCLRGAEIFENLLNEVLGATIWIGAVASSVVLLGDGQELWSAVDSGRRGEDQSAN